ncbi:MAG: fibronectin type III domain-containing protein [Candidatus Bipolaricaulota bacterium]
MVGRNSASVSKLVGRIAFVLLVLALVGALGGCFLFTGDRTLPPPDNVTATEGTQVDVVRVSWAPVDGASVYEVQRARGETAAYSRIGETTETTFDDTDAPEDITSWYRVRAGSGGEWGLWSDPGPGYPATEVPEDAPETPTGLSATRGDYSDRIVVRWDEVEGATGYDVYRRPDGEEAFTRVTSTGNTSYTDRGVEAGKSYRYRLRACSGAGCSALSSSVWGFSEEGPGEDEEPTRPRIVEASDGTYNDKIRVSWSSSLGATHYYVYRAEDDGGEPDDLAEYDLIGESTTTEYDDVDETLDPCQPYWYRVTACNEAGCSALEDARSDSGYRGTEIEVTRPSGLTASYGSYANRIEVQWDPVDGAVEYMLEISDNGTITTIEEASYTHEYDDGTDVPAPEAEYTYRVKACAEGGDAGCGCTEWSFPEIGLRLGKPVAPSITAIDSEKVGGDGDEVQTYSVTLTWTWTWDPDKSPNRVEEFHVYRRKSTDAGFPTTPNYTLDAKTHVTGEADGESDYDYDDLDYELDDPIEYTFEWEETENIVVEETTTYRYRVRAVREVDGDDLEGGDDVDSVTLSGP